MKLQDKKCIECSHSMAKEIEDGKYEYVCCLSKTKCYQCLSETNEADYFEEV